jgi:Na+:H+ antiporter, NhaC family
MDLVVAILVAFFLLIFSVIRGYYIGFPLLITLGIFLITLQRRGFALKHLCQMGWRGCQKSAGVIVILLLVGVVTAAWIAAGTVPAIVYYGMQIIQPRYFVVSAFLLTCFVSLLLGTSFGSVGTVGTALMVMARSSGVDVNLAAGAIIAGAYFGDRCSPMSSSAHLIATLTNTKIYRNIKSIWWTGLLPLILATGIYLLWSLGSPAAATTQGDIPLFIVKTFAIDPLVMAPAVVIFGLAMIQVPVKISMLLSLSTALLCSLIYQSYSLVENLKFLIWGFNLNPDHPLASIMKGGGLIPMMNVVVVVIISTALAGIFNETQILAPVKQWLLGIKNHSQLFLATILLSILSSAFGCTQTIGIIMTQQLVEENYATQELGNYKLATDLANTVIVISALIPWNIAGLVPAKILLVDANFIPYTPYLYLLPLVNLVYYWLNDKFILNSRRCN